MQAIQLDLHTFHFALYVVAPVCMCKFYYIPSLFSTRTTTRTRTTFKLLERDARVENSKSRDTSLHFYQLMLITIPFILFFLQ